MDACFSVVAYSSEEYKDRKVRFHANVQVWYMCGKGRHTFLYSQNVLLAFLRNSSVELHETWCACSS